ncbi:MAG: CvpA family protein [Bacteroidales bacterium]|nr:CvpA family protein [Bacteroidales bacterium]
MNYLDIIFLVPLLFAVYRGFKKGIIHMVASLAALVLGIFGAIKLRPLFASLLDSLFDISPDYMNVIAFSVAFVSIVLLVHLVAFVVEKLIKAVALNLVNRLLGMGFGLLVTAFVISMILWPVNQVNEEKQLIKPERIESSLLYRPLSDFAPAVFPYLKKQEWKEFIPRKEKEEENEVPVAI